MRKGIRAPEALLTALRSFGAGAFLAPSLACKAFDIDADAHGNYVIRLFAARNVALAFGLLSSRGESRALWWRMGVLCDALDVGAGIMGLREGKERSSAMLDTGMSTFALGLGLAGLRGDHA
jgi:hypothetical protein